MIKIVYGVCLQLWLSGADPSWTRANVWTVWTRLWRRTSSPSLSASSSTASTELLSSSTSRARFSTETPGDFLTELQMLVTDQLKSVSADLSPLLQVCALHPPGDQRHDHVNSFCGAADLHLHGSTELRSLRLPAAHLSHNQQVGDCDPERIKNSVCQVSSDLISEHRTYFKIF